LVISIKKL